MSRVVIKAESLGKSYLIGHQTERERYTALRDVVARSARSILHNTRQVFSGQQLLAGNEIEEFWALKDLNFEINQGDRVGIIGRNGAGKSTLLKILSRITEPSKGLVTIRGRVASLLEVGTGFHPELTGRENIYLNGAILGMTRAEIKRKFDEIVDFAGVEKFLDTPVKRYSSGMYVRLAFAVAAHLEPEILVVDEVLAVGDAEFQKKCLGKLEDVSKNEGRTVLFVSHNMGAIAQLCDSAVFLKEGKIKLVSSPLDCIDAYNNDASYSTLVISNNNIFEFVSVNIFDRESNSPVITTGNPIMMDLLIKYTGVKNLDDFSFRIKIFRVSDKEELYCFDSWKNGTVENVDYDNLISINFEISSFPASEDIYELVAWGHSYNHDVWEEIFTKKIETLGAKVSPFSHVDSKTILQLKTKANITVQ